MTAIRLTLLFGFLGLAALGGWLGLSASGGRAERKFVPIENIRVGDRVVAWDEATGEQVVSRVDEVYRRTSGHLRLLTIRFADGATDTHETTDEHPYWVVGKGWTKAGEITTGDVLKTADDLTAEVAVTERVEMPLGTPVYNFRVPVAHDYYVVSARQTSRDCLHAVLVHNANYKEILGKTARKYAIHECVDATNDMIRQMKSIGKSGKRVKIQMVDGNGNPASTWFGWGEIDNISQTGYHEGVLINGVVFDNLNPEGIPYEEWIKKFAFPRTVYRPRIKIEFEDF